MELIWKELDAVRLLEKKTDTVRVEGMMPTPDGRTPAGIPVAVPKVEVLSSAADKDGLHITGRITVMMTCEDGAGGLFAYESSASFKHDSPAGPYSQAVNSETSAQVVSIRVFPEDAGARLESEIELTSMLTSSVPLRVIGGVAGVGDLEMKTEECESAKRVVLGTSSSRMREELASEAAQEVLFADGSIFVRDVSSEPGAASVSGTLTVSAIIADSAGRPSQLVRQIPFREKIGVNGPGDKLFCTAELKNLWLRALGEEFGIISVEAEVCFTVYTIEKRSLTVPVDAFSPGIGFDCLGERTELIGSAGEVSYSCTVKENLPLPDMAADMASPLFAFSRALVTDTARGSEGTSVNGLVFTTVVYESSAGARHAFTEETPFSMLIESVCGEEMRAVRVNCASLAVGTGERSVTVQNTMTAVAELYTLRESEPVVGLAERETPEKKTGMILCFASEGDEAFDIAKRYSVPSSLVRRLNPDTAFPCGEGERLLLLV